MLALPVYFACLLACLLVRTFGVQTECTLAGTIVLIINGHPSNTGSPFVMDHDGTAKARSDVSGDMEKTDRFILEAPLATVRRFVTTMMAADIIRHPFAMQVLYGLVPTKHYRLHNVKADKCIRIKDEAANVGGAHSTLLDTGQATYMYQCRFAYMQAEWVRQRTSSST